MTGDLGREGISRIYCSLTNNTPNSLSQLWDKWEGWLGALEDADWRDALMAPKIIAVSARLGLVQTYFLHAAYLTLLRLHRVGLRPDALCPHSHANFYHMVWLCLAIQRYWESLTRELTEVLGWGVPLDPTHVLPGITEGLDGTRAEKLFLNTALVVAKRDIAAHWLDTTAPTLARWRRDVDWCAAQERPLYVARGCPKQFCRMWGKWVGVIED